MYLLDANVFIEAKNQYYRPNSFPRFWQWLDLAQTKGQLASIQMIQEELLKGGDELSDWARERENAGWFLQIDDNKTQLAYTTIADWVMGQPFRDEAKAYFLNGADVWLIAKALTMKAAVATLEVLVPQGSTKPKIPNVCRQFDIPYLNTFDLIQRLGVQF